MTQYDYLVVGAGLSGAVFAHEATLRGKRVLVIDQRNHIAGNCYTEEQHGILVHAYGPHIFHTNNEAIWRYVNQFAEFNQYQHRVMAEIQDGRVIPMPITLHTLNKFFGINTVSGFEAYFRSVHDKDAVQDTVEQWCKANIGDFLYQRLIKDYTRKQWDADPATLPASIIKRIPIRATWDTTYFHNARYQGIPRGGYTAMVRRMLEGVEVWINTTFDHNDPQWRTLAKQIVYSGSPDDLYDHDLGTLPYRSIALEHHYLADCDNYQGVAQMNYCHENVAYTRTIEHRHFDPDAYKNVRGTVISYEFPSGKDRYYPIHTPANDDLAEQYKQRARSDGYILLGRLGNYQYWDMDQVIANTLTYWRSA